MSENNSNNDRVIQLTCSLCTEEYNETSVIPFVIIPCGHTFCAKCLRVDPNKKAQEQCPTCKKEVQMLVKNIC